VFSTSKRIRAEFDFLLARGYTVVAESDAGRVGSIAYRSRLLWIGLDWQDYDDLALSFTLTGTTPNSIPWPIVDRVLNGNPHLEFNRGYFPESGAGPIAQLSQFVRENIDKLENQLRSTSRAEFEARLRQETDAPRAALREYVRTRRFR